MVRIERRDIVTPELEPMFVVSIIDAFGDRQETAETVEELIHILNKFRTPGHTIVRMIVEQRS